ncbi:MAG: DUF4013 domain-containing protein [Nitrososphaerota archaeon]
MKLKENLRNSLDYVSKLFKDGGRAAILILLNIIPIVNFIVTGYFGRVIKESPESDAPPPLEKYGALWVEGLKIVIVSFVYMIVPIILLLIGFASISIGFAFFPFIGLGVIGGVLIAVGLVLSFLIAIVAIMGIIRMVKTDRMGEAFNLGEILSKTRSIGWVNYIVWLVVIFLISLVASWLPSQIPIIGWAIALIVAAPLIVFIGRSASILYESGISVEKPPYRIFCGYCGNPLSPEDKFCGNCGKPVSQT